MRINLTRPQVLAMSRDVDFSRVAVRPLQATLNRSNIVIQENQGLKAKSGYWWLRFNFDYALEKGIEVRLTNYGCSDPSVWRFEILKCHYLGIDGEKNKTSFELLDKKTVNAKELARLQELSASDEKLRNYLETNVLPLVRSKIKYTRFVPNFCFFLSHKTKDKKCHAYV